MAFPRLESAALEQEAGKIVSPILEVLSSYGLTEQQHHWQRVLRAVMGGFAFHEQSGGFSHFQADASVGKKVQPMMLSLMRKGGFDIPFMFLLNRFAGVKLLDFCRTP